MMEYNIFQGLIFLSKNTEKTQKMHKYLNISTSHYPHIDRHDTMNRFTKFEKILMRTP